MAAEREAARERAKQGAPARLRARARQTLRYELEGAAKDGRSVPGYGEPGHEGWEEVCHARDVLALLADREALTSLEPLLSVRFDGTEDMVEHAEALAGLERAREIVARALRGEG